MLILSTSGVVRLAIQLPFFEMNISYVIAKAIYLPRLNLNSVAVTGIIFSSKFIIRDIVQYIATIAWIIHSLN